jgi:uncharacterized damage-inducible protein DinB
MQTNELLILNLEEVRRRSIKIWRGIPADKLGWKPDGKAMSFIETVRHVLKGEWGYMQMLRHGASLDTEGSPFKPHQLTDIETELARAATFRVEFMQLVGSYSDTELTGKLLDRSDIGYVRTYGDFILRIAYHESVHAGQLLGYLRGLNVPRPNV